MRSSPGEPTVEGELRWNVKQSFRDYVLDLPDGEETWTGASGGIQEGDLVFTSASFPEAGEEGEGQTFVFEGGVCYGGYYGMLRVELSDPWVVLGPGDTAEISVNIAPAGLPDRRAVVATAIGRPTLSDDTWRWDIASTALSAAGAAVLGAVYPPGTEAAGFSLLVRRSSR